MEGAYHAVMREVASVYEVPVVDAPAQPDEYIDFCHVNAAGHARIGRHVARKLERMLQARQVAGISCHSSGSIA
jgi:lysophospholipase L1-like esterase